MRIHRFIVNLSLLAFASSAFASDKSYKLPITRNGKTTTRVAHNMWVGEYPGPVINVMAGQKGYYTAKGYKSLRKLNEPVKCSIKKGLYHPWSKTPNSVINFYTISPQHEVKALQNAKFDEGQRIKKGETIKNIIGIGEGFCIGQYKSKVVEFSCGEIDGRFREITPNDDFFEQWLYVKCKQGYNAFIEDDALLKQKGIKKGQIESYGKVTR